MFYAYFTKIFSVQNVNNLFKPFSPPPRKKNLPITHYYHYFTSNYLHY